MVVKHESVGLVCIGWYIPIRPSINIEKYSGIPVHYHHFDLLLFYSMTSDNTGCIPSNKPPKLISNWKILMKLSPKHILVLFDTYAVRQSALNGATWLLAWGWRFRIHWRLMSCSSISFCESSRICALVTSACVLLDDYISLLGW